METDPTTTTTTANDIVAKIDNRNSNRADHRKFKGRRLTKTPDQSNVKSQNGEALTGGGPQGKPDERPNGDSYKMAPVGPTAGDQTMTTKRSKEQKRWKPKAQSKITGEGDIQEPAAINQQIAPAEVQHTHGHNTRRRDQK